MQTRGLYGGYDRLDPGERFSLFVAAEGRSDADEVERLLRSCPTATYRLRELPFTERLDCSCRLTLAALASLEVITGKLDVVDALEEWGRCVFGVAADAADFEAFQITGTSQPSVRRERGRFRRLPRRLRATLLADAATTAHAFARVCHEQLEVDARQLVIAVAADYVDLFHRFIVLAPDTERLDALTALMAAEWRCWLGEPHQGRGTSA
jgi:hypothetical protein